MSFKDFLVNARTKILEFKKKHNLLVEKTDIEIEKANIEIEKNKVHFLDKASISSFSNEEFELLKQDNYFIKNGANIYSKVYQSIGGAVEILHFSRAFSTETGSEKYTKVQTIKLIKSSGSVTTKNLVSDLPYYFRLVNSTNYLSPKKDYNAIQLEEGSNPFLMGSIKKVLAQGNTWTEVDNVKKIIFSTAISSDDIQNTDILIFTCANSFCFFGVPTNFSEVHGIISIPSLDTNVYQMVRCKLTLNGIEFGSEFTGDMSTYNFGWQVIGLRI